MANGDLTFWQMPNTAPTASPWALQPDVVGNGFPEYKSQPFVKETQTIGGTSPGDGENVTPSGGWAGAGKMLADAAKSLDKFGTSGVIDAAGGVLGNVVNGVKDAAGNAISDAAKPWLVKGAFIGIGVIFLAAGLWAIFKTAPQEMASAT